VSLSQTSGNLFLERETGFLFFGDTTMIRMTVYLNEIERDALSRLARAEKRDVRAQAAMLICEKLEERGLLAPVNLIPTERDIARADAKTEVGYAAA
jgi:hypothetical protein